MRFCIQLNNIARESLAVISEAKSLGLEWYFASSPSDDDIPIGSVEFCEKVLYRHQSIIDFYPHFLKDWRKREIYLAAITEKAIYERHLFRKSATEFKPEKPAQIVSDSMDIECGLFYLSEVVSFTNEWRYYIANGKVITTGWYDGDNEEEQAPKLNIDWPKNYNGAVDFGRLDNGEIALVEAHPPFACGHYSESHRDFVVWQYQAWLSYKNFLGLN